MTLEERQAKAQLLIQQIQSAYGLRFVAVVQAEGFNDSIVQIRANVTLQPIAEWQDPELSLSVKLPRSDM